MSYLHHEFKLAVKQPVACVMIGRASLHFSVQAAAIAMGTLPFYSTK